MPFSSADPAAFVGLAMQTGLGVPNVTAVKYRYIKYITGNSFSPEMEVVDLREGGDGLDYGSTYKKMQKVSGQLVANARPETLGQVLLMAMGGYAAGASAAGGPYQHTYMTGHASFPYATIQAAHPATSLVNQFSDVKFTGLTLEGQSGEPWKWTAPWTGIRQDANPTILTPTYIAEDFLLFHQNPTYMVDGALATTLNSFKIDLKLGVDELQSQAVNLDEILVMNRDIDVEFTRRFEDPTLWKKIWLGGGTVPTVSVATGSFSAFVSYGTTTARRSAELIVPVISYRGNVLTELDPDGKTIYETVSGQALKGATHSLIARVETGHASVYSS